MLFKPYNGHFRTTISPNFVPNYWSHLDQIFYAHGAVQKSFNIYTAIIPSLFLTDIINTNLTDMSLMVND